MKYTIHKKDDNFVRGLFNSYDEAIIELKKILNRDFFFDDIENFSNFIDHTDFEILEVEE